MVQRSKSQNIFQKFYERDSSWNNEGISTRPYKDGYYSVAMNWSGFKAVGSEARKTFSNDACFNSFNWYWKFCKFRQNEVKSLNVKVTIRRSIVFLYYLLFYRVWFVNKDF